MRTAIPLLLAALGASAMAAEIGRPSSSEPRAASPAKLHLLPGPRLLSPAGTPWDDHHWKKLPDAPRPAGEKPAETPWPDYPEKRMRLTERQPASVSAPDSIWAASKAESAKSTDMAPAGKPSGDVLKFDNKVPALRTELSKPNRTPPEYPPAAPRPSRGGGA